MCMKSEKVLQINLSLHPAEKEAKPGINTRSTVAESTKVKKSNLKDMMLAFNLLLLVCSICINIGWVVNHTNKILAPIQTDNHCCCGFDIGAACFSIVKIITITNTPCGFKNSVLVSALQNRAIIS